MTEINNATAVRRERRKEEGKRCIVSFYLRRSHQTRHCGRRRGTEAREPILRLAEWSRFFSLSSVHRNREEGITKYPYWCQFGQPLSPSCRRLPHQVDCDFLASVAKCEPSLILRYAASTSTLRVSHGSTQSATTAFSNCRKAAPKGSSSSSWAQ